MTRSRFFLLAYFMAGDLIIGRTTDTTQPVTGATCSSNTTEPMYLCDKEHPATCIPRQSLCNGISDCPRGQDEAVSECGCLPNEFRCSNSCVALVKRCDRHVDCEGGEDEQECQTFLCPITHYKCNNHFCVPLHSVCDFKDDCGDNSEEFDCPHRPCWNSEFRCNNGECLRPGYLCDSKENCMDGSDESFCEPEAFVECGDGSKVHSSYWCDDWPDCTDNHADEINCHECNTTYEFQCPNGRCIRKANRCDSQCDCIPLPNSTSNICADEINCDQYYTVKHGVVLCIPGKSLSCSAPSPVSFGGNDNTKVRCIQPEFLCDGYNDCHNGYFLSDEFGCDENIPNRIDDESQMFICRDGRIMPANLRCDFKADCLHGDDEVGCPVVDCELGEWTCSSGQCIDLKEVCDLQIDCLDKSDEINCHNYTCGPGQTKCTGSGQCISQDFWCDHFLDCPDASDEINCSSRKCRFDEFQCNNGQCIAAKYRCYNSGLPRSGCADGSHLLQCKDWECKSDQFKCHKGPCLHESLLCDGSIHCAGSWEDEDNCSFPCSHMSPQCECRDIHLNCSQRNLTTIPVDTEKEITWFYLGGNRLNVSLNNDTFLELGRLVYLDLSNNSIVALPPFMFRSLWRLSVLDLHNNHITHFVNGTFYGLSSLKGLHLQGNNIKTLDSFAFSGLTFLTSMDLHGQVIEDIETDAFYGMRNLTGLDLSQNRLTFLSQGSLRGIPNLLFLDLSRNQFRIIEANVFHITPKLEKLVTDEFRFCCLARHTNVCLPPPDEFSSCEDLMSNIVLRLCVWLLAGVATIGNVLVIIWRTRYSHCNQVHSFLITNLALGDLLMGSYLLVIALVDCYYRGDYIIHDSEWRSSGLCALAGFLSTFSSELSVFTLTVITLDRFLVIIFPFRVRRMEMARTKRLMAFGWIIAAMLSALPLIPIPYFYNFYGRSGVCLALHITPDKPNGWEYSVFVFLFLNLVSFGVIAVGYLWMFIAARTTQHAVSSQRRNTESAMAWRMSLLVATDAACWVPIIILGFASLTGFTVPPQVFAWVAVFVLPLNAAVNPVLYTISTAPFLTPAQRGIHTFRRSCRLSHYTYSSTVLLKPNDSPRSDNSYHLIKRTSIRWHQRIDTSVTEHGEVIPLRQLGD